MLNNKMVGFFFFSSSFEMHPEVFRDQKTKWPGICFQILKLRKMWRALTELSIGIIICIILYF